MAWICWNSQKDMRDIEGSWWCNIKWTTLIISYIDITLYQQGTLCHAVAHFNIFAVGECRRGITLITAGQSDSKPQLSWTSFSCGFTRAPLLKCMIPNVLAEAQDLLSNGKACRSMAKHAETRSNLLRFSIHAKNCLKKFTGKTNEAPSTRIHCGCQELLLDDCCGIQCPLHPTHRSGMGLPFTPGSLRRCLEGILRFPGNCRSWSSLAEELPSRFKRGSQGQMNVVYIYI